MHDHEEPNGTSLVDVAKRLEAEYKLFTKFAKATAEDVLGPMISRDVLSRIAKAFSKSSAPL